jgi:hypothetical protein
MSKIEDDIFALIQSRAAKGLEKYGATLERDDLTLRQWLDHAIEESLDRVLYLYRARMKLVEDDRGEAPADGQRDSVNPLESPRLQEIFSTVIDGAHACGYRGDRPPPDGHWLHKFWLLGKQHREAIDKSREVQSPAEVIPWAEYPWANYAAKDEDGSIIMTEFLIRPVSFPGSGTWEHVAAKRGWGLVPNARIPGPWTESLRKRPEGL